jgi:Flp pilus assembly protein TadD
MKDYARAIADYTEAFRLDPDYAETLMRRGIVRRLNGDKTGGDADVAAAKKIDPDLVE